MKDTVQELVDALDVMTTSILERIIDTWILRLKLKPGTSYIFLTNSNRDEVFFTLSHGQGLHHFDGQRGAEGLHIVVK